MSDWNPRVVRLGEIKRHENATNLSITEVDGNPVVFSHVQNNYKTGDLVVYIPIDTIVPDEPQWAFLEGHRRIRAKKLRGIFSMGMLAPLPDPTIYTNENGNAKYIWTEQTDVIKLLKLIKYEPDTNNIKVELSPEVKAYNALPVYKKLFTRRFWVKTYYDTWNYVTQPKPIKPKDFPVYTDIESLRKYKNCLQIGEEVIITEKIHGSNFRAGRQGKKFFVGSHYQFKSKSKYGTDKFTEVAQAYDLEHIIPNGYAFYGEIYGLSIQKDFKYDTGYQELGSIHNIRSIKIRFFDIWDFKNRRYLDYPDFESMCKKLGLPMTPELYRGPWLGFEEMEKHSLGKSTLNSETIREGFVVKPVIEKRSHVGRHVFKLVGQDYLLNKNT